MYDSVDRPTKSNFGSVERHTNQWNRTERLKINLKVYRFSKTELNRSGIGKVSSTKGVEKLDSHM